VSVVAVVAFVAALAERHPCPLNHQIPMWGQTLNPLHQECHYCKSGMVVDCSHATDLGISYLASYLEQCTMSQPRDTALLVSHTPSVLASRTVVSGGDIAFEFCP
jgi:hypothetical protein